MSDPRVYQVSKFISAHPHTVLVSEAFHPFLSDGKWMHYCRKILPSSYNERRSPLLSSCRTNKNQELISSPMLAVLSWAQRYKEGVGLEAYTYALNANEN